MSRTLMIGLFSGLVGGGVMTAQVDAAESSAPRETTQRDAMAAQVPAAGQLPRGAASVSAAAGQLPRAASASAAPDAPVAPNADVVTLTPLDAIAAAVKHNPELGAAFSELRSARALVEGEEHRYTFVWGAEAGVTRTKNPSLGPAGTMVPQTDDVTLSTDLRRRFSHGGSVGLTVAARRFSTRTYFGLPPQAFTLGPAYGASVKLDATQPLLRGAGNAIGETNLNQARVEADRAAAAHHRATSDGLAAVLRAYWELVYAERALQIQTDSLELARAQRDEAHARVDTGALALVELTSFETRVAQLESDRSDAELEVERRRIELERLCAIDVHGLRLDAPPEQQPSLPSLAELQSTARIRAPNLRELKAAVALAESRASIAGDALRPALDVNAYVQAQGLDRNAPGPAWTQVGELSALSAHVGIRYETSLDSTQRRMQVAQARYNVTAAQKRLESAERQIEATLQRSYAESRAATRRVELAARAVELAERQHQAEKALFETGGSTAIRVREAEEQIRVSRLRWFRARIDAIGSEIELDRISGRLGEAYLHPDG